MQGPPSYSLNRGHPALGNRHRHFEVSTRTAERWLFHMEQVLDEFDDEDIEESDKSAMMNYFRHTAYFLVSIQETQWDHSAMGIQD